MDRAGMRASGDGGCFHLRNSPGLLHLLVHLHVPHWLSHHGTWTRGEGLPREGAHRWHLHLIHHCLLLGVLNLPVSSPAMSNVWSPALTVLKRQRRTWFITRLTKMRG